MVWLGLSEECGAAASGGRKSKRHKIRKITFDLTGRRRPNRSEAQVRARKKEDRPAIQVLVRQCKAKTFGRTAFGRRDVSAQLCLVFKFIVFDI